MATSNSKRGTHTWEILQDLSSDTGQGNLWIVAKRGDTEATERILQALALGVVKTVKTRDEVEAGRRDFEKAMLDFVEHRYTLGALKQLKNPRDEEARARLRLEASVYNMISDPHLIRLLDSNFEETEQWIVTEYQPNKTLDDRLQTFKGNALGTLTALRPVVNALARLHAEKLVHRDFKPGNIFVGRQSQLVLGDAGLAFLLDKDGRVTRISESVGTQHYMPAWALGRRLEEIRPAFDVFSVGKVLWAMVAGESTCPLWYFGQGKYNLTQKFPSVESMYWINWLLAKCVVETEDQMQILDAAQLGREMDLVISAIQRGCLTPDRVRTTRTTWERRRCSICGIGECLPILNSSDVAPGYQLLGCSECDHVEYFWSTRKTDSK